VKFEGYWPVNEESSVQTRRWHSKI